MAVYQSEFIRITAIGHQYATEEFAWTLSVDGGSATVPDPTAEDAAAVLALVRAFHTTSGMVSSNAFLDGVKVARIGTNGKYASAASPVVAYATPATGVPGTGTVTVAPQMALAVSLSGPAPRGPAGRGRFYVPMPAWQVGADGRISAADALKTANAAVTMLNGISARFNGAVSIVGAETLTGRAPASQPVASVRVGRVLDTIRSRRTSLDEDYQTATEAVVGLVGDEAA